MRTIHVETDPPYPVHVGAGLLERVADDLAGRGVAVLADARALELHGARLGALGAAPRRTLAPGEASKCFAELEATLDFLARARLDRRSCLVAFGGGVTGDLGGLAASLFKRGIDVVHAPTTLLAQVDASIGGKTAINLAAGKNLAGTVHQPRAVYADSGVLATLPESEWLSGLGEVVKSAIVGGADHLDELEACAPALPGRGAEACASVVASCAAVKAAVVAADPLERGPRRALNLGHTFAHAIEHAAGYGAIPHGIAVAVGLVLALRASRALGLLEDAELEPRVDALLARLGLPRTLDELRARARAPLPLDALMHGLEHDKKGAVGAAELVLVRAPGRLELGVRAEQDFLRSLAAGD